MERQLNTSPQLMKVLRAFMADPDEWRLGEELIKAVGLKPPVVYAILGQLQSNGLAETAREEQAPKGRPPRQLFRLTEAGIEAAYEAPIAYQSQWKSTARRKLRRKG
jgi:DNA-binding PadR family transcriptional regulator